jgi:hypothetical protein
MYQIKVRNYKDNRYVGGYSFKTKAEARRNIEAIAKHHYLKKCGYDYMNYEFNLELQILF